MHVLLLVLPEGEVESEGQLEQEAEPEELSPCTDHSAVKPLRTSELSDVNVTLRKPVDELYTLDELTDDPESLPMRSVDSHVAVSQRSIDT